MDSNKKTGIMFEKMFSILLKENKFWARLDKGYAQTCDIIAGKNNKIYLFECKVCKKDSFSRSRVEENQSNSRRWFIETGNENAYFVFYVTETKQIYLSKDIITRPSNGINLERWMKENE